MGLVWVFCKSRGLPAPSDRGHISARQLHAAYPPEAFSLVPKDLVVKRKSLVDLGLKRRIVQRFEKTAVGNLRKDCVRLREVFFGEAPRCSHGVARKIPDEIYVVQGNKGRDFRVVGKVGADFAGARSYVVSV